MSFVNKNTAVSYMYNVYLNSSTETQQESRLIDRNDFTSDEAKARISSQIPIEDKKQLADHVIDNSGLFESTGWVIAVVLIYTVCIYFLFTFLLTHLKAFH